MTRQDHTHGQSTPDAGTSHSQRQGPDDYGTFGPLWVQDQIARAVAQDQIARIRRKMDFNGESV